MTSAFRAAFSDMKLVKTRQVAQLIFEIPLSDFDAAYEVLGGMPNPANERWFGIAALQVPQAAKENQQNVAHDTPATSRPGLDKPAAGTKREWRDLSPQQQAGIRCAEPTFVAFLKEQRRDDWHEAQGDAAECVRLICGVHSRAQLEINHRARIMWKQLDDQFVAWKSVEHA